MLRSSEPWARAAATRVLCYWRDRVAESAGAAEDAGRRSRIPACGSKRSAPPASSRRSEAAEVALESLNQPQDRFLKYTLDQTMKTLKPFIR